MSIQSLTFDHRKLFLLVDPDLIISVFSVFRAEIRELELRRTFCDLSGLRVELTIASLFVAMLLLTH